MCTYSKTYSAIVDMVPQLASWEIHIDDEGQTDTEFMADIDLLLNLASEMTDKAQFD